MSEVRGLWFDGRSSRGSSVSLEREGDRLRLRTDDGREDRWPLREVVLSPRLGNTPRILRREGHGQLECADAPELAQWFPHPPSRIEAAADWLERRRLAIAFSAVAVVLLTVAFVRLGVPWIAQRIAEHMPAAVERQLSDQVVAVLERTHLHASRLPGDRQRRLQAEFAELVRGEPRAEQMRLRLVDAPAIGANAFTLPDGRIYLTDQLVALAKSDEEVMAVLAHEAGHHVGRHAIRQAIESSSVFLAAGLVFGDVSGSTLAVSVPAVLLGNGFSRGHEEEADAYAFDLLRRRGESPAAFAADPAAAVGHASRSLRRRDRRLSVHASVQRGADRGRRTRGAGACGAGALRLPSSRINRLHLPAYPATPAAGQHRESTMVKIRLTRGGAKKRPFYHVIVTDSRSARDGRNIERVGYYNPVAAGNDKPYELDLERMKHWVGLGAQMSEKVSDLYKQASKAA